MQQKHMKRRGMTLLEVIISIAVYAVLALLLAEIMTLVNSTIRSTEQLNQRLSYEAKFADNLLVKDGVTEFDREDVKVTIQYGDTMTKTITDGRVVAVSSEHELTKDPISHDDLVAGEYETQYDETSAGTHFHDNTNYRFMIFNKTPFEASEPADFYSFTLWLNMSESEYDDFVQAVVAGNFYMEPSPTKTLKKSDFVKDSPDSTWYRTTLRLVVNVPEDPDTGEPIPNNYDDVLTITIYRGHYTTAGGKSLSLKQEDESYLPYASVQAKYVIGQRQGTEMNFYKGYDYVYCGNATWAAPSDLTAAQRTEHGIPDEMEVNYPAH